MAISRIAIVCCVSSMLAASTARADGLRDAVISGDAALVSAALADGADVNQPMPFGTALHRAAFDGEGEIVRLLIESGANINALDGAGRTPLIVAVLAPAPGVVKLLLAKGADPLVRDTIYGDTALHYAAYSGSMEMAGMLIEAGVDVNLTASKDGNTPLLCAAAWGKAEMVSFLASQGADLHATNKFGVSAKNSGSKPVLDVLKELGGQTAVTRLVRHS